MARDLIVLAEDWGGLPTSTQHLIRNLPGKRRILWVNSVGQRRPRLTRHDMARLLTKARDMVPFGRSTMPRTNISRLKRPEGMELMAPRVLPFPGINPAFHINQKLLGRQIRIKAKEMGLDNPVLWISFPNGLPAMASNVQKKTLYYCADDYGAIEGVDHETALQMERELVKAVDLILVSSELLAKKFPRAKSRLLLHGVDVEKFQTPAPRAKDLPDHSKIAGFYGSFLNRIDVQMLRQAALDLPDWQFVFIGKVSDQEKAPLNLPNVVFLGSRRHDELPGYVQHWTVSLLPFLDCPMVRAMNPLKLREYLAAGTPIASVEFPALNDYKELVCATADRQKFSTAILQAQADGKRNKQRQQSVAGESWTQRAIQAHEIMEQL